MILMVEKTGKTRRKHTFSPSLSCYYTNFVKELNLWNRVQLVLVWYLVPFSFLGSIFPCFCPTILQPGIFLKHESLWFTY